VARNTTFDRTLDVRGLLCPMPLIRARQEVSDLAVGEILKVVSTDRASTRDFQGWAEVTRSIELLDQAVEDDGPETLYIHYVMRLG